MYPLTWYVSGCPEPLGATTHRSAWQVQSWTLQWSWGVGEAGKQLTWIALMEDLGLPLPVPLVRGETRPGVSLNQTGREGLQYSNWKPFLWGSISIILTNLQASVVQAFTQSLVKDSWVLSWDSSTAPASMRVNCYVQGLEQHTGLKFREFWQQGPPCGIWKRQN